MTSTTAATQAGDNVPVTAGSRSRDPLLGASGLAFVVVLLLVVVVPHPSLDYPVDRPPSSSVLTHFFEQHKVLEQYQALMHSVAGVLLLVFGAALAAQVRRFDDGVAARLVSAGAATGAAVMVLTMALVSGTVTMTGGIDGRTQGWLYDIGWTEHFKVLYLVPLVLAPACSVLGRSRALPRALTGTGLLVAVLAGVAMVAGTAEGTAFLQYPVFFALMVWVLATSVVALTRGVGDSSRAR